MHHPLSISHLQIGNIQLPVVNYWGEQWVPIKSLAIELEADSQRITKALLSERNLKMVRICTLLAPHDTGPHQLGVARGSLIAIHGRLRPKDGTKLSAFLDQLHLMAGLDDPEQIREQSQAKSLPRKTQKRPSDPQAVPFAELTARADWVDLVHKATAAMATKMSSQPTRGRPATVNTATAHAIQRQHANGTSIEVLAGMYRLANDTIRRIVKATYRTNTIRTGTHTAESTTEKI